MPKNVELKAKIKDFNKIINIAKNLCGTNEIILHQEDTFFNCSRGRFKLRDFKNGSKSQLIFYERPDTETPKVSDYSICLIDNPKDLLNVLKSGLGIKGRLIKTRYLFLYHQTRIHIDRVENLGDFLEFEVVLTPDQNIESSKEISDFLMTKFEISEADLIKGAYIDLLQNIS